MSAALKEDEEPIFGRYYGILNVEGDDPKPRFLFSERDDAERELARRQALTIEQDPDELDRLGEHYAVLEYDIEGVFWNNCLEPNPRPPIESSRIYEMQCEIGELKCEADDLKAQIARLKAKLS